MQAKSDYHFNLFQPYTEHGRKIRNLILTMLAIWAVCVFGFQILLKVVEKPTPEVTLNRFEAAYASLEQGSSDQSTVREFLHSQILAAGKNVIKPADREVLVSGINLAFRMLIPDSLREPILATLPEMISMKEKLTEAKDQEYLDLKTGISRIQSDLMTLTAPFTGFTPGGLESVILVSSLKAGPPASLSSAELKSLPAVMKLYLTHNQSFLTDFKFLGFPFHYFYTAVFLLILFVSLCLFYNLRLDRRMRIEKIEE
jgi:putative solute:sodium symporter small subunit